MDDHPTRSNECALSLLRLNALGDVYIEQASLAGSQLVSRSTEARGEAGSREVLYCISPPDDLAVQLACRAEVSHSAWMCLKCLG